MVCSILRTEWRSSEGEDGWILFWSHDADRDRYLLLIDDCGETVELAGEFVEDQLMLNLASTPLEGSEGAQPIGVRMVLNRYGDNRFELRFETQGDSTGAEPAEWQVEQAYLFSRAG